MSTPATRTILDLSGQKAAGPCLCLLDIDYRLGHHALLSVGSGIAECGSARYSGESQGRPVGPCEHSFSLEGGPAGAPSRGDGRNRTSDLSRPRHQERKRSSILSYVPGASLLGRHLLSTKSKLPPQLQRQSIISFVSVVNELLPTASAATATAAAREATATRKARAATTGGSRKTSIHS